MGIDQHPLQTLELGDGAAELPALLDIVQRQVIGPLGDSQGDGGGADGYSSKRPTKNKTANKTAIKASPRGGQTLKVRMVEIRRTLSTLGVRNGHEDLFLSTLEQLDALGDEIAAATDRMMTAAAQA